MVRERVNGNVDYLYKLQKDETGHQDHRLMWILTAQALIFTGLCSLLPEHDGILHTCIMILLISVGVLLSISGLYSMMISRTAIGTVYERWCKYDSSSLKKKMLPLHHLVSLAPSHFLNSKTNWLMFCYFAPNVFCAAWITLLSAYLLDKFHVCMAAEYIWLCVACLFAVLLIIIVCISQFMGKYHLYHWGYDQYHETEDEDLPSRSKRTPNNDRMPAGEEVVQKNSPVGGDLWENLRIYHIMVDRFNGSWRSSKDEKGFMGGTIRGIIEKIDYIKSLGYNAILLTPVFKSDAYHGYHTTDYETIDEHFGSWKDFDDLVDALHRNSMKLLCDYVPNHCHIDHPIFRAALNDSDSPYRDWFYFDAGRKGGFVSYQNFPDLPKFNLYNEAASDYLISIAVMLAKRGVDGLRIDHVIGVPFVFLKNLRCKVKEINPYLFLFGEAWFGHVNDLSQIEFIDIGQKAEAYKGELSQEDIQLNYVNYLDGVLDFQFRNLLLEEVTDKKQRKSNVRLLGNKSLRDKISMHFDKYPDKFQLILFLDNHDTNRFLYHCDGDKLLLKEGLAIIQNFYRKPHAVYYGTEQYMMNKGDIYAEPYGDEQVRKPMDWQMTVSE